MASGSAFDVVVRASRPHAPTVVDEVRPRRPHHNPLSNALPFVGHASRVPGVRAAFPSSVSPTEGATCHGEAGSYRVSTLSFRPREVKRPSGGTYGKGGKSEIRNPKFEINEPKVGVKRQGGAK